MTRVVKQWAQEACAGRLISCLEGGYNLETLGETVRAHVAELEKADGGRRKAEGQVSSGL